LHVFDWPAGGRLEIPLDLRLRSARLVHDGTPLSTRDNVIDGPTPAPDPIDTVIALTCRCAARATRGVRTRAHRTSRRSSLLPSAGLRHAVRGVHSAPPPGRMAHLPANEAG